MNKMIITRVHQSRAGTFGVIQYEDNPPFALTAELPWLDNARDISCIPSENYLCELHNSPRFGKTYRIDDVPGRSGILFHKGNIPPEDSRGCILIGEQFEKIDRNPAILHSGKGFDEFMQILNGKNGFLLKIKNIWGF